MLKAVESNNLTNNNVSEGEQTSKGRCETERGKEAESIERVREASAPELGGINSSIGSLDKDLVGKCGDSQDVFDAIRSGIPVQHSEVCPEQILSESGSGGKSASEHGNRVSSSGSSNSSSGSQGISFSEQLELLRNPVAFCQAYCSSHTYVQWQRDFLLDCRVVKNDGSIDEREWPRTVVLAAVNGSGKTQILADVIRYLLSTVPGCVIPITSPIYRQLEMLESYLKTQNHKFEGWDCIEGKLTAPNGNYARWFATDKLTSVESFHGQFLVRIIEEAKAFSDPIFDQTNRWQPKLTIIVSSKGLVQGRLYEAVTKNREYNRVHEVDAFQCPWISQPWIEEQIREHGRQSALIKSMVFNEFSDVDVRNLINIEQINKCFGNPPPWRDSGVRVAGIDFSAAKKDGDEMICVKRQGNKIFEPYIVPHCESEMEAVGLVLRWLRAEKINFAFGDVGSMGGTMMSRLREVMDDKSIQVHEVGFGSKALFDTSNCKNRGTELWKTLAGKLELRDLVFDWTTQTKSKFIAQATSRSVENTSDGDIKLESKDKMRARGLKSPDCVDAVALALIEPMNENRSPMGTDLRDWNKYKTGEHNGEKQNFGFTSSGKRLGRG